MWDTWLSEPGASEHSCIAASERTNTIACITATGREASPWKYAPRLVPCAYAGKHASSGPAHVLSQQPLAAVLKTHLLAVGSDVPHVEVTQYMSYSDAGCSAARSMKYRGYRQGAGSDGAVESCTTRTILTSY